MADTHPPVDPAAMRRAATFFSRRPEFLGYWLDLYLTAEDLAPAALARHLGCEVTVLDRLSVCFRPRADHLWEDTQELAEKYGIDQERLCDLLYDAETYARTQGAGAAAGSTTAIASAAVFAAASDREPDPEPTGEAPKPDGDEDGR